MLFPLQRWLLLVWLLIGLGQFVLGRIREQPAVFDAVWSDQHATGRFLSLWLALAVLTLSALPTLGLAVMLVNHEIVRRLYVG